MDTSICVRPEWCAYIRKNQEILKGWIQYNLITYLQRRNPNVPGISSKLEPPQNRKAYAPFTYGMGNVIKSVRQQPQSV